jgi:hypothetical protein
MAENGLNLAETRVNFVAHKVTLSSVSIYMFMVSIVTLLCLNTFVGRSTGIFWECSATCSF